ncbi:hypothetical protein GCM10023322_08670 [Rugosimonospora acidiphila]|uniref:Uncharacterized protein n=1 Tax=Rugosimonospora acidiphila TaxID=556531 RepID=A0ABP9RK01_9ACTN
MPRMRTLPGSLMRVLELFRPRFTAPTFATLVTLLAGMVARPAHRTVCGMLPAPARPGCGITAGRTGSSPPPAGTPTRSG